MRRIDQDIAAGQFHKMYLLYGPERYLIRQYADKLKAALCPPEDTINTHFYQGKNISVGELIDLAETMPFLSEHRVIYVEDSGLFKSGGDSLAEYLADSCESTIFIFVDFDIDSKCKSKLFKAVGAGGLAIEFANLDEATLFRWAASRIKKEGKQLSENTLRLFLSKNTNDMQAIEMELEKLFCFCMHKDTIEPADVEAVCASSITDNVFDLVGALGYGNKKRALDIYYELIAAKEEPLRILSAISRQFHLLLQTKELLQKGFNYQTMAPKIGLSPYIVKKYIDPCRNIPLATLHRALAQCVEAEEAVKTGRLTDKISVEMLILTIGNV